MPLTGEQIRQRRTMSPETCRDRDIFRIADSLEDLAEALSKITDELFERRWYGILNGRLEIGSNECGEGMTGEF